MEHVTTLVGEWTAKPDPYHLEATEGARDFLSYLEGDLKTDLRVYLFRLEQGRYPGAGDQLPDL